MLKEAKWIWDADYERCNDWVLFRQEIVRAEEGEYLLELSADTRYFLWVNGEICVWDGGLFRDAYCENSGFIDTVNLTTYLHDGANQMDLLVWHYGNGGRNNNPLAVGGVIFACEKANMYSGAHTLCQRHPAFGETAEPLPSYLYGGYNIGYDANQSIQEGHFHAATELDASLFGKLFARPIPFFTLEPIAQTSYTKTGDVYAVSLPESHQVMPYLVVRAKGGEVIDIRSDRYMTPGGPGGGGVGMYNGHRTEYICKAGLNEFLNVDYMACETLFFAIPEGVEVIQLSYRISEYDSQIMDLFQCENEKVNRLVQKCARTLKVCMRDNFMDCPDRERGQWIGDVSVQAPQVFYALTEQAVPLLKKAIDNFIYLRKGDRLVGNVPGINFSELPSQSLNAISELGMIAKYYEFTGDKETLAICLEPMVKYLMLWEMGEDGMVLRREGDWCWFDHLNNQDKVILENTWYYSALCFSARVCGILGDATYLSWLEERKASIANNFESMFWKGKWYASGEIVDDRANAMAVLVGLANPEHAYWLRNVLITTFNASTYMEGYVCEALYQMGYPADGYRRMMQRYLPLIDNDDSTLWEDFTILGTKNHAWTGAPLTLFYKYVAGIQVDCETKTITLSPDFSVLQKHSYRVNLAGGVLAVSLEQTAAGIVGTIDNGTTYQLVHSFSLVADA